jgi:hypothetical protein
MAATPYVIDPIKSMALKGDSFRQLTSAQNQLTTFQNRLSQIQSNITTLQTQLRALQVQVLASLSPTVVVAPETSITMTVNNDGTVTLSVG